MEIKTSLTITQIDPKKLRPSPVNRQIYRPVSADDPEVKSLADEIKLHGILQPLTITKDFFIISGHRRREAAILLKLKQVPCQIEPIEHDDPAFARLLVSHNSQRVKNRAELMHEVVIKTDPEEAYRALLEYRESKTTIKARTIQVGARGYRKAISKAKYEFANAAIAIINANDEFWPLSDRQIHYRLLNDPPLRHSKKPDSVYCNDRASYQDLCDILTRLRLSDHIPMEAIADPTRPSTEWDLHRNPQSFASRELNTLLKGYRRDLQQTQPLHIEVIGEKMTIESIIRPVCARFNIPYTIGRGYASLPARSDIVERFKKSGKSKLLLLMLSDFDPEGINIAETMLQSIREDFGQEADAVRVGLNSEHIKRFNLIDNPAEAKQSSSRYRQFVRRYGKQVYELEALTPKQLQEILTESIDSVIDKEAFNSELEAERQDAVYLDVLRRKVFEITKDSFNLEA